MSRQPARWGRRGASMLMVLCLGAVLLALCASLLTAAAQLSAPAGQLLAGEQARQLALTFSRQLDAELCEVPDSPLAQFLTGTFLGEGYADDTPYRFTAGSPQDPYGALTVTLQRSPAVGAAAVWSPADGLSAGELTARMDEFQAAAADGADYRIAVTVTASWAGAEFSYTQWYLRRGEFPVLYTLEGAVYRRQPGTLRFYRADRTETEGEPDLVLSGDGPEVRGEITARYDPAGPRAGSRYENLVERGSRP